MTLTTEQLRARAAALRTDAATLAELGDTESSQRLNESANAFDELAANREAQPLNLTIPDIGSSVVNDAAWKLHDTLTKHGPLNGHQFNNLKGCLFEALKIIMSAPPTPAVLDEIDSFADQVIGTKDKIIRLPAPIPVPHEDIRVYLNADAIISYVEKQGYIVEVSRE
ncbi:hypothetical protein [Serratia marcescens]|uniref:hypothetical protein n=1 Tax=Serratia marcescens TaxID=615 RepID=UPI00148DE0B3|nr:hypothetical protein [Serratia marcescens]